MSELRQLTRAGGADKNLDTYRALKGVNDVFRRTENKGTACFPSDRICYRCGTSTWLSQQKATVYLDS
ncbi:ribosomal protein S27AE [Clostridium sp. SY8519]|nr:ribosomal protein S27AE [Clostridium sp. SY8519]